MSDQEDIAPRKATSRRGKKLVDDREPKMSENPRQTLFIRGPKSSDDVRLLIKEWYELKKNLSVLFTKKHELQPFEQNEELEQYCSKQDCSLFCFVSHSKKRPNNVVLGRTFDHKILDMVELGLKEFKSTEEFEKQLHIPLHTRPLLMFNGDVFGYNGIHMRLHNLLTDFFTENEKTDGIESSNDLNLIISINASEEAITITAYQRQLIDEVGETLMKIEEIGPRCVFEVRRSKLADEEQFKRACRQPKPKKKPQNKNVQHDGVGDKRGRVFVQQQDMGGLTLKKRKKMHKHGKKLEQALATAEEE